MTIGLIFNQLHNGEKLKGKDLCIVVQRLTPSGFRWDKLDGICNSFRIAETIQESPTPNFYLVSAAF